MTPTQLRRLGAAVLVLLAVSLAVSLGRRPASPPIDLGDPAAARTTVALEARLGGAPAPLQTHFVRQLAERPATERVPALAGFLRRTDEVHPGALLEAVLHLKRSGADGARALLDAYPTLAAARRGVVLQAFEADRQPGDAEALARFAPEASDPLLPRWRSLGVS